MWLPGITHPGSNPSRLQSIPAPAHGHGEEISGQGHGHHSGTGRDSAGAWGSQISPGVLRPTEPSPDRPRPSRRHRDLSLVLSAAAATPSGTGSGSGDSIAGAAWDTGTGSPGAPSPDTGRSPYSAWVASPGRGTGSAGPGRALSRSPSPERQRLPPPDFPPRRRHDPSPVPSQPYVCHRSGWRWCPGRCSAAPAAPSSPASSRPPRGCCGGAASPGPGPSAAPRADPGPPGAPVPPPPRPGTGRGLGTVERGPPPAGRAIWPGGALGWWQQDPLGSGAAVPGGTGTRSATGAANPGPTGAAEGAGRGAPRLTSVLVPHPGSWSHARPRVGAAGEPSASPAEEGACSGSCPGAELCPPNPSPERQQRRVTSGYHLL